MCGKLKNTSEATQVAKQKNVTICASLKTNRDFSCLENIFF